jgi:cytidylate kinase
MSVPSTIAIDGPAASGKTTLAQELARRLDYLYFDTGVMYRAVTLAVLRRGIDLSDEEAVARVARAIRIDVLPPTVDDGRPSTVCLNSEDVTWELRSAEVDATVSIPSAYATVRAEMTHQQRRIARRGGVVMVGRDIGTVVLPDADLKIYLDASVEARARRRWHEYRDNHQDSSYEDVLEAMRARDALDSQRAVAPLKPADDAVLIDTTNLTADDVLAMILALIDGNPDGAPDQNHGGDC